MTERRRADDARADAVDARAGAVESDLTALRREVAELKTGTSGLAEQIGTLSLALQTVGQLQQAQRNLDSKVEEVTKKAATKEDVEAERLRLAKETREHRKRELTRLYSLLALFSVVIASGVLLLINRYQGESSTAALTLLDEHKVQTMNTRVPGVQGPATIIGNDVSITGTKCNLTDKPLTVSVVASWITVAPTSTGTVIEFARASGVMPPGCSTNTYTIPMPTAVQERVKALAAMGDRHTMWELTGTETPQVPHALSARWNTEPFEIVVKR